MLWAIAIICFIVLFVFLLRSSIGKIEKSQIEINSKDRRTFKNITTTVWQNAMPELSKSNITITQSEILLWNSGGMEGSADFCLFETSSKTAIYGCFALKINSIKIVDGKMIITAGNCRFLLNVNDQQDKIVKAINQYLPTLNLKAD